MRRSTGPTKAASTPNRPCSAISAAHPQSCDRTVELVITSQDLPPSKDGGVLPRKNTYFILARGTLRRSQHARKFASVLATAAMRAGLHPHPDPKRRPIASGWWALDLLALAPKRYRSLDVLVPWCDSDACLSPVRDALQYAGIMDNDARIVSDRTWVGYREAAPELRLRLTPIHAPDEALAIAWPGVDYFGRSGLTGV